MSELSNERETKSERWREVLEEFARYRFADTLSDDLSIMEKVYYSIHGSGYKYLFLPDKRALKFISARIRYHQALKNRLAVVCLSMLPLIPQKIVVLPKTKIVCSKKLSEVVGELIIISGTRMKFFNFNTGRLYTLPLRHVHAERLKTEVEIRKKLENKINIPRIIYYDSKFPYVVEEIVGYPLYSLDEKSWPHIVDVFRQLIEYYKENGIEPVSAEKKISEIKLNLQKASLKNEYLEILHKFIKILKNYSCKDFFTTLTHGDIYLGNLVTDGKKIYITDWDFPRERLITSDLVYLLFRYYIDSGKSEVMNALLAGKNNLHRKYILEILKKFDRSFNIGISDENVLRCYTIIGILERIPLFESDPLQNLIFKRLQKILQLIQ